jgi:ATP-dependent 26S proteasome regulatory subunit
MKGLLFYRPPGTGKTHTIHYLASQFPQHTTLLITAEQVGLIGEYFRLARFLQPAMMVIEDVDLIAREREQMHNPVQEVLLKKLLNEMDGLREDADVIFILTTNRPDHLEPALASRPGRIDQAIEFPLPDEDGRRKLVQLYSGGLEVSRPVLDSLVRRTERASPALIKELMRRAAQLQIELGTDRHSASIRGRRRNRGDAVRGWSTEPQAARWASCRWIELRTSR